MLAAGCYKAQFVKRIQFFRESFSCGEPVERGSDSISSSSNWMNRISVKNLEVRHRSVSGQRWERLNQPYTKKIRQLEKEADQNLKLPD